jgi:hypothetical protein
MPDHVLRIQSQLTTRDHILLGWLADHGVLTSFQIAHALFPSLDFAQRRLTRLHHLGLIDRFRPFRPDGGSFPYHYVIDQLGAETVAAQRDQPPPRPDHARVRRRHWTSSTTLQHRLGVNQFFTDLAGYARTHPDTALRRWWPEAACRPTGAFAEPGDTVDRKALKPPIRPDGHGVWTEGERTVAWFLEYDTGREPLTELIGKIIGYMRMALDGGPAWPILFWLHATTREHHLHQRLAEYRITVPVATAARDHSTTEMPMPSPAGRVWWLHGHQGLLRLADLEMVADPPPRTP